MADAGINTRRPALTLRIFFCMIQTRRVLGLTRSLSAASVTVKKLSIPPLLVLIEIY